MAEYFKEQKAPESVGGPSFAEELILIGLFIIWFTAVLSAVL